MPQSSPSTSVWGQCRFSPVLTALWGAHALEMPQPAQHAPLRTGNSCLLVGADKLPALEAWRIKWLLAQPWLQGLQAAAGSAQGTAGLRVHEGRPTAVQEQGLAEQRGGRFPLGCLQEGEDEEEPRESRQRSRHVRAGPAVRRA